MFLTGMCHVSEAPRAGLRIKASAPATPEAIGLSWTPAQAFLYGKAGERLLSLRPPVTVLGARRWALGGVGGRRFA